MRTNNPLNVLQDLHRVDKFIKNVRFESNTPAIIRFVSNDADYLTLCGAIVNEDANAHFSRAFDHLCRKKGVDVRLLREKLIPVASALGLAMESEVFQDCYQILGLTPSATEAEIKKAFRHKARAVHPDTNISGELHSHTFIQIHNAYQTLSNPASRLRNDLKYHPTGVWNEQHFQNTKPPRKTGYIYMIGGLALFFIIAAFLFDFILREEVLLEVPSTTRGSSSVAITENNPAKSQGFTPDAKIQNHNDNKVNMKTVARIRPIEYIDTDKNRDFTPPNIFDPDSIVAEKKIETQEKGSPDASVVIKTNDVATTPKLSQSDSSEPEKKQPKALAHVSQSLSPPTLLPPKHQDKNIYTSQKDKIEAFLKSYCATYEKKNLNKFKSFFKSDALENGKPFHTLLPRYRHNFATIEKINYQIEMHQCSYLSDSAEIKVNGRFFLRWRKQNADWENNSGPISMRLEWVGNSFLVKQLDYSKGERANPYSETSSENRELSINDLVLKKKIDQFIHTYCKVYEKKKLYQFESFFMPDATENGKPFHSRLPQYRQNFASIDFIEYTIETQRHHRLDAKTVRIEGAFLMRWHKYNEKWNHNRGSISMVLSQEGETFRVKKLDYRFD